MDIIQDIKSSFRKGTYLTQLIYINIGVFLWVSLMSVGAFLLGASASENVMLDILALPADTSLLLQRPWTLLTYMFLHEQFFHILFNILWLYWLGNLFLQYFAPKHLLSVYLLGGFAGALLYILSYNTFPIFASALPFAKVFGASASVYAIVFATATYVPDYELRLAFLGKIKLKYIAFALIALDIVLIPSSNAGGHLAHLGGAILGFWFAYQYKRGKLITQTFERFLNTLFTLFKPKRKMKVTYKKTGNTDYDYQNKKASERKNMDKILEKISKSGYSSLSKEEKEALFKMSDKK